MSVVERENRHNSNIYVYIQKNTRRKKIMKNYMHFVLCLGMFRTTKKR